MIAFARPSFGEIIGKNVALLPSGVCPVGLGVAAPNVYPWPGLIILTDLIPPFSAIEVTSNWAFCPSPIISKTSFTSYPSPAAEITTL